MYNINNFTILTIITKSELKNSDKNSAFYPHGFSLCVLIQILWILKIIAQQCSKFPRLCPHLWLILLIFNSGCILYTTHFWVLYLILENKQKIIKFCWNSIYFLSSVPIFFIVTREKIVTFLDKTWITEPWKHSDWKGTQGAI